MRVLVDSNVLLRYAQRKHSLFVESTESIARLVERGEQVFFCAQNIAEFCNVATRPVEHNGLGLSAFMALKEVANIEATLTLLPDAPEIYTAWKGIVEKFQVLGVKVYDARLVAIMRVYSIKNILTYNVADFDRYRDIQVLHPSSIAP